MKYMAYVEKIDELIEEEVTININGVVFTGFSTNVFYIYQTILQFKMLFNKKISRI